MSDIGYVSNATHSADRLRERAALLARTATGRAPGRIEAITADSYSHVTFKVQLDGPPHAVAVQFARRSLASVTTAAQLLGHMAGTVDVPGVLHLADASDDTPAALVTGWLEGHSLNRLLPRLPTSELADLARAVAETVDAIWSHRLPVPGRIAPGFAILPRPASLAACIDAQLKEQLFDSPGGHALGLSIRERLWTQWHSLRPDLETVEHDSVMVHGDLAARNLLVRRESSGGWRVSVLDWEFAVSGCHLADVGHLLRPYPFVPPGYLHALTDVLRKLGRLEPKNWRALAWALDLTALTGPLVHGPGHPDNNAVSELIRASCLAPPASLHSHTA